MTGKTGNLPKMCLYTGIYPQHGKIFDVLKIIGCTRVMVGYGYNLSDVEVNFKMGATQ